MYYDDKKQAGTRNLGVFVWPDGVKNDLMVENITAIGKGYPNWKNGKQEGVVSWVSEFTRTPKVKTSTSTDIGPMVKNGKRTKYAKWIAESEY